MSLEKSIVAAAKKEYTEFSEIITNEVESKLRNYLSGFTKYLEDNAFKKEEE